MMAGEGVRLWFVTAIFCAASYGFNGTLLAEESPVDFFEKKIRPVLVERCYKCHSASSEKLKGGLLLDTREGMLKGGETGKPAIVPGDPEASLLIEAIRYQNEDLQMPPKERLTERQVADFVAWINAGAADPRTNRAPVSVADNAAKHWAFQPPRPQPLPSVKRRDWAKTPIDHFILAKIEKQGLFPAPEADKRTLLRRAAFDLTGLPPSHEELNMFLRDKSPEAFARAVDRLLASPHYGERWGRHWLDVARYSDTKGYVYDREEKRFVHSHVYRDWVIRACNDDMPYDRFLTLQIAADRLPGAAKDDLAAMGFLTVGRRFLGVMHDIIDDRIDVVGRATMGLTVSCARCHDHKFDPIPTRDYYSLYGVFNSCNEEAVPILDKPLATDAYREYEKELKTRVDKLNKTFQAKRNDMTDRLRAKAAEYVVAVLDVAKLPTEEFYTISGPDDLNPVIVRQWEAYIFKTQREFHPIFAPWHTYRALPERDFAARAAKVTVPDKGINPVVLALFATNTPGSMREVARRCGSLFAQVDKEWRALVKKAKTNGAAVPRSLGDPNREALRQVLYGSDSPAMVPDGAIVDIEWFFDEDARVELAKLQAEIDRWNLKSPGAPPHAVILTDRATPKNARVFIRGNPANKGDEVSRQFLEVVAGPNRQPFREGSGRLELARAIATRDNPLTARVMVNRIWHHHFGAGLVRTPSDFGTRCEPPSHPELLDWLALHFMDNGWSIKKLHKLILLSSVYQQSTGGSSAERDPENKWLARMTPRRLDFEAMRDSLLWATGELDPAMGGKGVELFKAPFTGRRTVYGFIDRQFVPGVLRVFDFANPDLHIPQRPDTTVPQQALFFMNSPFVVERARSLASVSATSNAAEQRVQRMYRVLFQREATRDQVKDGLEFVRQAALVEPPLPPKPVESPWKYGYGEYDSASQRIKAFHTLPHFADDAWQGGSKWPDSKLGWVQLTAEGGHAGNDLQHAAIRRWTASRDCAVSITGALRHEHKQGDGIRGRIVSSRAGLLGEWILQTNKAEIKLENIDLKAGDTLDFVVDFRDNLNSDDFKWAPVIKATASEPSEWSAKKDFAGPPQPPPKPLDPWEQYAQVLLLSNEFLFVD
ncbi:MAG: PSD1 and planctomycete cytochrome C domain-containing protein [Verrucomicrobia subdivision 3 bacterium]|nr:PSD1 and planctomycete cytochrome C domain-containing protein [Limisphaerales bacterium]